MIPVVLPACGRMYGSTTCFASISARDATAMTAASANSSISKINQAING